MWFVWSSIKFLKSEQCQVAYQLAYHVGYNVPARSQRTQHIFFGCGLEQNCRAAATRADQIVVPGAAFPESRGYSHSERSVMKTFVVSAALVLGAMFVVVSAVAIPHQAAVACSRACMNCCPP
jgi:hypothetical protein